MKSNAPPAARAVFLCCARNASTDAVCTVVFEVTPRDWRFFLVTLLTTHGSISTKCDSTHPRLMASMPMAPVPAKRSSHRESGGNAVLLRLPMSDVIMSNVAPRTIPIIGLVSNPEGDRSLRLDSVPATMVSLLCVRLEFSFCFLTLNASTALFSLSSLRSRAFGTPICSIFSVSSSFLASSLSCFDVSSPLLFTSALSPSLTPMISTGVFLSRRLRLLFAPLRVFAR